MNKMLKTLVLGISLATMVNTATATQEEGNPLNNLTTENAPNAPMQELKCANATVFVLTDHVDIDPPYTFKPRVTIPSSLSSCPNQNLTVKLLDAEAGQQGNNGTTALMLASEKGLIECIPYLCAAEQGMHDKAGDTALIRAAQKGKAEAVITLLEHAPIELGMENKAGLNALKSAILFGNINCVQILMRTKELFAGYGEQSPMDFAKEILDIQKDADSQQIYTVMVNMLEEAEAKAQK